MLFWIIAAALTTLTVGFLVRPLMRGHAGSAAGRAGHDLAVYRDQLQEVDKDLARGLVDERQAEAARAEIGRRMLAADAATRDRDRPAAGAPARRLAMVLAVAVPLAALGLYIPTGQPELPGQPIAARERTADRPPAEVLQALDRLGRHLEANPEDLQGWLLLGQVYDRMGRFSESAEALRRALAISQGDPGVAASFAEARVKADQGVVGEEARRTFEAVLEHDPDDPRARYYLALARAQAGDFEDALERWSDLVRTSPADAPWLAVVSQRIAEMAGQLGRDVASVMPQPLPPAGPPSDHPPVAGVPPSAEPGPQRGPTREQMEQAADMTPEQRREMIRGMVASLAQRLEREPGDVDGWMRLGRAYQVLGEAGQAADAYARAAEAAPDRPEVLGAYAEALIDAAPGEELPTPALDALRKVVELRPDDATALYFLGLDAARAGRSGEAAGLWERLLVQLDPAAPEHADLSARIEQLKQGG